jgi:hypothetical protein
MKACSIYLIVCSNNELTGTVHSRAANYGTLRWDSKGTAEQRWVGVGVVQFTLPT